MFAISVSILLGFTPRSNVRMQTVTLTKVPGTPGGHDFAKTLPGITAPFGFFDPLDLIEDCAQEEILRFREAELAHGRVSMMAVTGCAVGEVFHPMFAVDGPAIRQLDLVLQTPGGQSGGFVLLLAIFFSEIYRARIGWKPPGEATFMLQEGYSPGDLGFDPLGLKPQEKAGLLAMQNKELNNGRLAMLGVAGIVAQELVDGKSVF
eukprot:CAMPEP_0119308974 /NCGR_PEP_ID=MMETSP1333-20130426/13274_1 /TAXON_ID=418940 /ORGANISM="Scyphosphaera apsteinii, Strain RCC1455" /LENGTH=205 /DNA_ID=CAMNT_0007312869 /DNA_START=32 /DNA_END=649 /DNA_ORIENTATION=+